MRRGAVRRAALLLLVVPVAGAAASCAPRTLRTDQLERRLVRAVESQLDVDGIRVACPAGVRIREGETFECLATAPNGDELRIRVTQVDDDGGVRWSTPGLAG